MRLMWEKEKLSVKDTVSMFYSFVMFLRVSLILHKEEKTGVNSEDSPTSPSPIKTLI